MQPMTIRAGLFVWMVFVERWTPYPDLSSVSLIVLSGYTIVSCSKLYLPQMTITVLLLSS